MRLVRFNKVVVKIICSVLSASMIFTSALSVQAKTTAELQKEKEKIQSEINSAQKKIDGLKAEKAETQEYVNALMSKVDLLQDKISNRESEKAALQKQIDDITAKIASTEKEIEKAQQEIDKKQAEFEAIYEQYCQRLRAMYISGNVSTLEILLESGDMSSVLTRAEMVKCVSEQDSNTLDTLMKKMQEIQKEKQALEEKKIQLKDDKASLDSQKAELQEAINDLSASKKELDSEVAACNAAIKKLDSQTSEIRETISANKKEQQAIDNEISKILSSSSNKPGDSNYTPGTGQLAYPTSYHKISAGYPNYRNGSYHGGVDFSCPSGTPVHAADSGKVVIAKSLTYSYGKYIVIDHGNGLSTLYAHNSSLCVSVGQSVQKGDIIAYSGSTGNSTGPHLHFEVRLNGTRVNPLSYL